MMSTDAPRAQCHVSVVEPRVPNGETIVLVHGAMHTGQHYLRTLDDRPGWADNFADAGYRVLVPDWPGTGQSPPVDPELVDTPYICDGLAAVIESVDGPVDLLVHSMSGPYGYALLESHADRINHLVGVAPGQPFHIAPAPDVIEDEGDELRTMYGPVEIRLPKTRSWVPPSREFVTDKLVGTSSRFPPVSTEAYLQTLEPMWSGLFHERLRLVSAPREGLTWSPLPGKPVLIMTGTEDRDHTPETDQAIVDWLRGRGAAVTYDYLGERGIEGNGHMPMLETNSAELAGLIVDWLKNN